MVYPARQKYLKYPVSQCQDTHPSGIHVVRIYRDCSVEYEDHDSDIELTLADLGVKLPTCFYVGEHLPAAMDEAIQGSGTFPFFNEPCPSWAYNLIKIVINGTTNRLRSKYKTDILITFCKLALQIARIKDEFLPRELRDDLVHIDDVVDELIATTSWLRTQISLPLPGGTDIHFNDSIQKLYSEILAAVGNSVRRDNERIADREHVNFESARHDKLVCKVLVDLSKLVMAIENPIHGFNSYCFAFISDTRRLCSEGDFYHDDVFFDAFALHFNEWVDKHKQLIEREGSR
jgi:hypothetical protein